MTDNSPQKKDKGGRESIFVRKKLHFWIAANIGLVLFIALLGLAAFRVINGKKIKPSLNLPISGAPVAEKGSEFRRVLDGEKVLSGMENPYPIAVMIDNNPDARPQAGLARANLVIEAEVEGGVTRYLAIFLSTNLPERIGPVRSARPYFVDWAHELSAVYTHCGGSPEALVKVTRENIIDLNEFYKGDYFWRDKIRKAPHNVYTSQQLVNSFLENKNLSEGKFFSWLYKDDAPKEARPADQEVYIGYRIKGSKVTWKYNPESNNYERYLGQNKHQDDSGESIRAKNIIIQTISAQEIDKELRLKMEVVGEGQAVICRDGVCETGKWQKKNPSARTRFYKADGSEFEFNAGVTWIEVARPEIEVRF